MRITKQQMIYYSLYKSGLTMEQIAQKFCVNKSTVCRVLQRAERHKCPFSSKCEKCPLPDCAIKGKYAYLVNSAEDKRFAGKVRNRKI